MNNIDELIFHIHYCNDRRFNEPGQPPLKIARTLQHHELLFVCNGTGRFNIKDRRYTIKKNMLLYISPGHPYSIQLDTTSPADLLTVHFSYATVHFNEGKWDIAAETRAFSQKFARELEEPYLIEEQFQKLVDCWNQKLPGYEFMARTMLQQLIIVIMQNLNKHPKNFANSMKIEQIIQHMHQNIQGKITIPELSDMVQMTPAYMSRTFKEITGYTIIEYFNKLKVDKAKTLLIEGDKKIKEVSQELGFVDEFYFSRMFKKIEGITPSQFYSRIVHGI